jgi:hypothetical protein
VNAIAIKALIIFIAAVAVGAGVALFVIAKQDGSKTGQILGVVIPILAILSAVYFTIQARSTSNLTSVGCE